MLEQTNAKAKAGAFGKVYTLPFYSLLLLFDFLSNLVYYHNLLIFVFAASSFYCWHLQAFYRLCQQQHNKKSQQNNSVEQKKKHKKKTFSNRIHQDGRRAWGGRTDGQTGWLAVCPVFDYWRCCIGWRASHYVLNAITKHFMPMWWLFYPKKNHI